MDKDKINDFINTFVDDVQQNRIKMPRTILTDFVYGLLDHAGKCPAVDAIKKFEIWYNTLAHMNPESFIELKQIIPNDIINTLARAKCHGTGKGKEEHATVHDDAFCAGLAKGREEHSTTKLMNIRKAILNMSEKELLAIGFSKSTQDHAGKCPECDNCKGNGYVDFVDTRNTSGIRRETCRFCHGTGTAKAGGG